MAKLKIYEAPASIIANITVFVLGKPTRVSFTPVSAYENVTGKASRFQTSNENLQAALEAHPLFKRKFFLYREKDLEKKVEKASVAKETPANVIKVSSPNDAREYLNEKFGIPKKNLRQISFIKQAAKEHGIVFDGI